MKIQMTNWCALLIISLLFPFFSMGQGWEKVIPGNEFANAYQVFVNPDTTYYVSLSIDETSSFLQLDKSGFELSSAEIAFDLYSTDIVRTDDGHFVSARNQSTTGPADPADIGLNKFDANGNLIWHYDYGSATQNQRVSDLVVDDNGDFVFAGGIGNPNPTIGYIAKMDDLGNVLWYDTIPGSEEVFTFKLSNAADGGYLIAFAYSGTSRIVKYTQNGVVEWTNDNYDMVIIGGVADFPDGSFAVSYLSGSGEFKLLKLDSDGTELWEQNHAISCQGRDVIATSDGGIALLVNCNSNQGNNGIHLIRMDADGNEQWTRYYPAYPGAAFETGYDIKETLDGGFIIAGATSGGSDIPEVSEAYIIKTDANGYTLTNEINGRVFYDVNNDCNIDVDDIPLENWIVTAIGSSNNYYSIVDANGSYTIRVDTGDYQVIVNVANDYWVPCIDTNPVQFLQPWDTVSIDMPIQSTVSCPLMEVHTSSIPFRLCDTILMAVHYCNDGTLEAEGVTIEVTIEDGVDVVGASIPIVSQEGSTYTFDIGNVDFLECGNFTIDLGVTCDIDFFGQTLCVETLIFPDTTCIPVDPLWSGASIEARARCEGDEVKLGLYNVGASDMQASLNYIVVEDDVIMMVDPYQLDSGDSSVISLPANGTFYRIESPQVPFHPGESMPSAHIEACGINAGGGISTGFVSQYPQNDADFNVDILCREVVAAYDPNQKEASPVGYQSPHYIEANTLIDYTIQFQNTGTDTARKVVLKDLLSIHLDPSTFQAGASSHPYEVKMEGEGLLLFTFDNIMLPDSNINEPASHGFVQFKIAQQEDLPVGTVIENTASIFFDFNPPIITNTVYHTIGKDFIIVNVGEVSLPDVGVSVYPNPFSQHAVFEIKGLINQPLQFQLFNATGQLLKEGSFSDNRYILERDALKSGMYFYTIKQNGVLVNQGKVIVH